MREVCLGVLVVCVAHAQARGWQNESTPTSLTDARNALGGDAALSGVRAMRMVGRGGAVTGPAASRGRGRDRCRLSGPLPSRRSNLARGQVFRGGDRLQRGPVDPAGQCGGRHSDRPLRKLAGRTQESRSPICSCRSPEGGRSVAPWVSSVPLPMRSPFNSRTVGAPNRRTARRNSSTYARPTDCRHGCSSTRGHDCL